MLIGALPSDAFIDVYLWRKVSPLCREYKSQATVFSKWGRLESPPFLVKVAMIHLAPALTVLRDQVLCLVPDTHH